MFFEGRRLSLINLFQLMSMGLLYVEEKRSSVLLEMNEHTVGQYALFDLLLFWRFIFEFDFDDTLFDPVHFHRSILWWFFFGYR